MTALIGTAGWSLPRAEQAHFPGAGSHLERYATRFRVAEINSSFHRSHRPATWTRWCESVPAGFLFSIKMPKTITHTLRLQETHDSLQTFLTEISALREKVGCLLVQLPPSLAFDAPVATRFFESLRTATATSIACEPRHASWFSEQVEELLVEYRVARVAADPARVPAAAHPGGWSGLRYYRLHGSPRTYYSSYEDRFIAALAHRMREDDARAGQVWAIFDNTTLGAATRNALDLVQNLSELGPGAGASPV